MFILIMILAFFVPRLSIIILWFFTHWFSGMFTTLLWPIIGFIFLPTTLLWYSVVYHYFDNSWSMIPIIGIVVALLVDLSPAKAKRSRD